MARIVNSNSLLVATCRSSKSSFPSISAKKSPNLPFFKQNEDSETGNSKPFSFDFPKSPDIKSLVPIVANPTPFRRKEPNTVFVAGATGQAGVLIAQALLREGFTVRAGVPDLRAAQDLAQIATTYKLISREDAKRLNAVESDFRSPESIAKAIGAATKVVVTISRFENGPADEVSPNDAWNVVKAAELAGVGHVAVVYDTNAAGSSTYNVLDGFTSFFSNLFSRTQLLSLPEFLQRVIETNVAYTVVKAAFADSFSADNSYNLVISEDGSSSGTSEYKVSKKQIASLVASVFGNTEAAENKVVEVYTDPQAPSLKIDAMFCSIPEDKRRKIYAENLARISSEEQTKKLQADIPKVAEESKTKEEDGEPYLDDLLSKANEIRSSFSWEKLSSQIKLSIPKEEPDNEEPKVRVATVRGQAKARSLPSQKPVMKSPVAPKKKEERRGKSNEVEKRGKSNEVAQKAEVRSVFGGLFKQETIYMDD